MRPRIFITLSAFCLLATFLYSCSHIHPGYEKETWSRSIDGLSVFPKVSFDVESPVKNDVVSESKQDSEKVKTYSKKIASSFKKVPVDFEEAERLYNKMLSECKGEEGLDRQIFRYLSTFVYLKVGYQQLEQAFDEYQNLLKKKKKNKYVKEFSKSLNKEIQEYFPLKNLESPDLESVLEKKIIGLECKIRETYLHLSENNKSYSDDMMLEMMTFSRGYSFFFVGMKDNYFNNHSGIDRPLVEGHYSFEMIKCQDNLPIYRTGEKVYVRAYSIYSKENPELEFTIYKTDPVYLLKEKISFYDLSPPSNATELKSWKQKVKGQSIEGFSFDYFDSFYNPYQLGPELKEIDPPPPEPPDVGDDGISIDFKYNIELPIKEPGFYIIGMSDGSYTAYTPVMISDLNLMTKYDGDLLLAYSDKSRMEKTTSEALVFTIAMGNDILHQSMCKNGICAVRTEGDATEGYVIASSGDHHALSNIKPVPAVTEKKRCYVYTDRPVYRPGHKVNIKVISRKIDPVQGSFTIPEEGVVIVKVKDSENKIIKTVDLLPNEFGSGSFDLELNEEAPLGTYTVTAGENESEGKFEVREYRKAECEINVNFNKTNAIKGEPVKVIVSGTYYHGKPLKDRQVNIVINEKKNNPILGKLDEYGKFAHEINTEGISYIYIKASVRDVSGRWFSGSGSLEVYDSAYTVSISSAGVKKLELNEGIKLDIRSEDIDDNKIATEVLLNIHKLDSGDDKLVLKDHKLKTGDDGKTYYDFSVDKEGEYKVTVTVKDSKGRKANDSLTLMVRKKEKKPVADKKEEEKTKLLFHPDDISLASRSYKPSEQAELKIKGKPDAQIYFCNLDTLKINSFFLVPENSEYDLELPDVSSISELKLQVYSFQNGRIVSANDKIKMTGNYLDVKISTPKKKYEPGENVDVSIESRKWNGEPIDSELSLAVVDKAVIDNKTISHSDIKKVLFKGVQYDLPVETKFRIPYEIGIARSLGGRWFGSRSGAGRSSFVRYYGGAGSKKRKNFKDTGFWDPALLTGKDGDWNGNFKLPDDITAWQLKSLAVSEDGKAGEATSEIVTAKDFMLRLIFPRTFTESDSVIVSAVIDNYSKKDQYCNVVFEYDNCKLTGGKLNQSLMVPAGLTKKVNWEIKINSLKPVVLSAFASTKTSGDGEERTIPVIPLGAVNKLLQGGTFSKSKDFILDIPKDVLPESVDFQLGIQPTPKVANLISGLKYLVDYPYGCVEQTMSRFMPSLSAKNALLKFNIKDPELQNKLEGCVSQSLKKLYGYQHDDGGWGWWKHDATNSYLTAYVLYGFSVTKSAGYEVDKKIVERGLECLSERISKEKDLQMKSFMVMAYSYWKKTDPEWIKQIYEKRLQLKNFGLGALLIACKKSGTDNYIPTLLKDVEFRSFNKDGVCSWSTKGMKLTSGNVQSTAFMLRALLMADSKNRLIIPAVNYLVNKQKGGRWSNTKDSAAATEAISLFLEKNKVSDKKGVTGGVKLNNGKTSSFSIKNDSYNTSNILKCGIKELRKGENKINVKCNDDKTYGFSLILKYRSEKLSMQSVNNGLNITREYEVHEFDKSGVKRESKLVEGDVVKQGSIIKVNIKIAHSLKNAHYFMLEDYFPAGCEVIEAKEDSDNNKKTYTRLEFRDEKAVFFLTDLPDSEVMLSYELRAETPGVFTANPANGELMYQPHINGHSDAGKVIIEESKGIIPKNKKPSNPKQIPNKRPLDPVRIIEIK